MGIALCIVRTGLQLVKNEVCVHMYVREREKGGGERARILSVTVMV